MKKRKKNVKRIQIGRYTTEIKHNRKFQVVLLNTVEFFVEIEFIIIKDIKKKHNTYFKEK